MMVVPKTEDSPSTVAEVIGNTVIKWAAVRRFRAVQSGPLRADLTPPRDLGQAAKGTRTTAGKVLLIGRSPPPLRRERQPDHGDLPSCWPRVESCPRYREKRRPRGVVAISCPTPTSSEA